MYFFKNWKQFASIKKSENIADLAQIFAQTYFSFVLLLAFLK